MDAAGTLLEYGLTEEAAIASQRVGCMPPSD